MAWAIAGCQTSLLLEMNLRKQLLLVSLLTLILPWAGCEFIRETESALRQGQQQFLGRRQADGGGYNSSLFQEAANFRFCLEALSLIACFPAGCRKIIVGQVFIFVCLRQLGCS